LRLEGYVQDAERDGDTELAELFAKAQRESTKGAEQGKALLAARLGRCRRWLPAMPVARTTTSRSPSARASAAACSTASSAPRTSWPPAASAAVCGSSGTGSRSTPRSIAVRTARGTPPGRNRSATALERQPRMNIQFHASRPVFPGRPSPTNRLVGALTCSDRDMSVHGRYAEESQGLSTTPSSPKGDTTMGL